MMRARCQSEGSFVCSHTGQDELPHSFVLCLSLCLSHPSSSARSTWRGRHSTPRRTSLYVKATLSLPCEKARQKDDKEKRTALKHGPPSSPSLTRQPKSPDTHAAKNQGCIHPGGGVCSVWQVGCTVPHQASCRRSTGSHALCGISSVCVLPQSA